MVETTLEQALCQALRILRSNVHGGVLYASSFYRQVWTRDVSISAIALRFLEDREIRSAVVESLRLIERQQSARGQVPTYIDLERGRVYWYSVDSTLLWVIACLLHDACRPSSVLRALRWAASLTLDESMLLVSLRGCDWMDASLGREGRVLYVNVLWYAALRLAQRLGLSEELEVDPEHVRRSINALLWPTDETPRLAEEWGAVGSGSFLVDFVSRERMHYVNYVSYEYLDDRFDTLANLLAILVGVADAEKGRRVMRYIEREELARPYPIRCLHPVVHHPGLSWVPSTDLFRPRFQACLPYRYHNGAVWPFIGGIYVATLTLFDRSRALAELERLAEANRVGSEEEWEFNEWLHGVTGRPMGSKRQLWNAATYVLAYQAAVQGLDPRRMFELG